jgi:hypothetical protein
VTKATLHHPGGKDEATGVVIGPRGISTKEHGDVMLAPGEVRDDLKLSDEEQDRAEAIGLKTGKPKASEDDNADTATVGTARAGAGEGANEPGKLKAGEGPEPKTGEEKPADPPRDPATTERAVTERGAGAGTAKQSTNK